jgi:hypothetical protein
MSACRCAAPRVAAAEAEDRAAATFELQGRRRRRRHGDVAGHGIGDARADADACRCLRGQRQLLPHLGREILTVGQQQRRKSQCLEGTRELGGATRGAAVSSPMSMPTL